MSSDEKKASDDEFKYNGIPEENAWFLSRLFFAWERPLFRRANKLGARGEPLQLSDLLPLPAIDHSDKVGPLFEDAWKRHQENAPATASSLEELKSDKSKLETTHLRQTITDVIKARFIVAGVIKFFNTALQFSFPLLLNAILRFIEETQSGAIDPDTDPWYEVYRGYWLSGVLFLFMAAKAITENNYFHMVYRASYQARVAVSIAVYNKSLRLTNAERQSTTLGELINLMQVDATKIEGFIPQAHVLWDGALQILGYIAILYTLIGWPVFIGVFIMLLAGPVQGKVMGKLFGLNRKVAKFTDARVEKTNEALQGIQSVKMYTWEESFEQSISGSRMDELNVLKSVSYLRGFARAYMGALPGIVAVCSFIAYALASTGADLSASTLFSALVAFNQIRFPLLFYPMAFAQLAQAKVSAARVEVFLSMKEIEKAEAIGNGKFHREDDSKGEIIVQDATAFWNDPKVPLTATDKSDDESTTTLSVAEGSTAADSEEADVKYPKPTLKNVSLHVAPGELCAVVGRVASGKSSLCAAVLNEMLLESGDITLKGKVAYAAQSPWILNATLRDNILFGLPMDQDRYDRVLDACQLTHDLEMLEDGDMTEIGERGINLSGGQKQRVSIARAAYADADTYIFDDPLSALDPEVGKKLFEDCILGQLKGKTIMFVTNQIQFLRFCDSVVALRHGRVIEHGKYTDLIVNEKSEVKRLLTESANKQEAAEKKQGDKDGAEKVEKDAEGEEMPVKGQESKKDAKALTTKEEQNVGAVEVDVYRKYVKAGGGYCKFMIVFLSFVLTAANQLGITAWVSFWTSDIEYERHSEAFYLSLYMVLSITLGVVTFLRSFLLVLFGVKASETLHGNLLHSILRAPQSFFDTTPLGRIISRFSKDLYAVDSELSMTMVSSVRRIFSTRCIHHKLQSNLIYWQLISGLLSVYMADCLRIDRDGCFRYSLVWHRRSASRLRVLEDFELFPRSCSRNEAIG